MKPLKFASIDIGSNAIRFLLAYVYETEDGPLFRKGLLLRVPLRLGDDAFKLGRISIEKEKQMIETMHSFKHLMNAQEIISYKAFATSAMRDALNGPVIVDHIEKTTGIKIDIISGEEEANVISGEEIPKYIKAKDKLLFVDVGGGSTEFTYHNKKKSIRESFDIGTIRYMTDTVHKDEWKRLKKWLAEHKLTESNIPILGSGGNINKIYKQQRRRTSDLHISTESLRQFYEEMRVLTYTERIIQHNLNPDRADVIIPACEIFLGIIDLTGTKKIYVPKIGLSDGIVRSLYQDYKEKR
ncbi:MAG: exopolyphosphatase/guanosine-5'-triphosphate,3'-diphosphate pyrophosphatase [Bacteroidia bacterium]